MATVFSEIVPAIEIRGDHAFIGPTSTGDVFVYSLSIFRRTHRRMGAVLAAFDQNDSVKVVPLCELCVRHDLPRDTH